MRTATIRFLLLGPALRVPGARRTAAQCRDLSINQRCQQLYNRQPVGRGNMGECNAPLYNNGAWGRLTGLNNSAPSFHFGSSYGMLAAGQRRVPTSGKGALVVR